MSAEPQRRRIACCSLICLVLALAAIGGSQVVRVSLSRAFTDKWLKTQPNSELQALRMLAERPLATKQLREEANVVLGESVYSATLLFEQLDAGLPGYGRASWRGRLTEALGGFAQDDLSRVRHALRIELKHLGVPYPYNQAATETWFRARYGQDSAEWWHDHKPGPVPHSDDLRRWLETHRDSLPSDPLDRP